MREHYNLENSKLLSTQNIPLRWVDMDAYYHVNNARYFDYMAETRASFFAKVLADKTIQFVLVHVSCDFKKPLVYPKTIQMKQYFSGMSRTTVTFHYTFHDEADDAIEYAIGEGILVCLDTKTQKPVPVPEAIKNLLT